MAVDRPISPGERGQGCEGIGKPAPRDIETGFFAARERSGRRVRKRKAPPRTGGAKAHRATTYGENSPSLVVDLRVVPRQLSVRALLDS